LYTLIHHAKTICDAESLEEEMEHVKQTFGNNGYSNLDIEQACMLKISRRSRVQNLLV
jgi:hypothetical protein